MVKRVFFVLASLVWLMSSTVVLAQAAKKKPGPPPKVKALAVAVMPVEGPAQLAQTAAIELADIGVFTVVPEKKTKAVFDLLQKRKVIVPGCVEKKKCALAAGKAVGAKLIYHLGVTKGTDGVELTMRALDVKTGKEVRKVTEMALDEAADQERATRWLVRKVSSPMIGTLYKGASKGKLEVACSQPDAELVLNGKPFGKKTGKGFKVSAGVFDIVVQKEGFKPFHDVVVVKPNQDRSVTATLEVEGAADLEPPELVGVAAKTTPPPAALGDSKEGKELPPWAVFEKPKEQPKPEVVPPPLVAGGEKPASAPKATEKPKEIERPKFAATMAPKPSEPFLPQQQEPPVQGEPPTASERRFYQTWWFWTLISVAAVGGTAGGLYAAGVFGGGTEAAGHGAAMVSWE
jgi:hypothetical protein